MSRERQFAMIPCRIDKWTGWTDLEPLEQWAYHLLRRQPDINQAGVMSLHLARWASEAAGMTVPVLRDLLDSLAQKQYIVVSYDYEELLICWFITTDHVYKKPNPLTAAVRAIDEIRAPGIKTALHNELKTLDNSHDVPLESVATVKHLVASLEPHALIGTNQPLHNPSTTVPLPVNRSKARRVHGVPTGSVTHVDDVALGPEPGQGVHESGQDNRSAGVVVKQETGNVKQETENPSSADAADADFGDDDPEPGNPDDRPEVRALCEQLAEWIIRNGETRPVRITKTWLRDMRLLVDVDGRAPEKIAICIDWCQRNAFWRTNVQSPRKLREKYNTLRLQAKEEADREKGALAAAGGGRVPQSVGSRRLAEGEALKALLRTEGGGQR